MMRDIDQLARITLFGSSTGGVSVPFPHMTGLEKHAYILWFGRTALHDPANRFVVEHCIARAVASCLLRGH